MKLLIAVALTLVAAPVLAQEMGAPCTEPIVEVCSSPHDIDGDGLIGCFDPDCAPEGSDWICSAEGVWVPACQPLLDDPAKIRFKYPTKLDKFILAARGAPPIQLTPQDMDVSYLVLNDYGIAFYETIPAGMMVPYSRGTKWKYKMKKTEMPMIYSAKIIEKWNKLTFKHEYLLKFRAIGDAGVVDPGRNGGLSEEDSGRIGTQVSVGPYNFYIYADWERVPAKIDKPLKGWKLRDKYMSL